MNSRKLLSLRMALCLTICFAGCSPKKTSTAPIMFVFSKMDYSDANATFSLFINEEGGELRKAPDSFIGYCVDDEGSMKIVDKILGKMPLKDKELDYYGSYRDYLDIG